MRTRRLPLLLLAALSIAAAPRVERPASQRLLSKPEEARVASLLDKATRAVNASKFADALEAAREAHQLRAARQGASHWQAIDAAWEVKLVEQVAPLKELDRRRLFVAIRRSNELAELVRKGDGPEAIRLGGRIVELVGNTLGKEHPWLAEAQSRLGWVYDKLGRPYDAAPLHESALRIRDVQFGPDHPSTALACDLLARNLEARGDPFRAGPLYQRNVVAALRLYGPATAEEATALGGLGRNLSRQGRHGEAYDGLLRALKLRRTLFGERHADTAQGYGDLGENLLAAGRPAEARLLLDRALDLREEVHGAEHVETARAFARLAECQRRLGRFPEAEALFREALKIHQSEQGADHADTAEALAALSSVLRRAGKQVEAGKLYESVLFGWRKRLGANHLRTAAGLSEVAAILGDLDRHADALPLLQRALAARRRNLGDGHPDTLSALADLAGGLSNVGQHQRASDLLAHVVNKRRTLLGEHHPDTADARYRLAACLARLGAFADAEVALGRSDAFLAANLRAQLLIRAKEPALAFGALERSLALSLLDDPIASARLLSPEEQSNRSEWRVRVRELQQQIDALAGAAGEDNRARLASARKEYDLVRAGLPAPDAWRSMELGSAAGRPLTLAAIQKQIPANAALVGWVERPRQPAGSALAAGSWACIVRSNGEPIWVGLPGSGKKGEWTDEDDALVSGLRKALADPGQGWRLAASHVHRLWLAPLEKHLAGVERVVALPSGRLRGIPLEALQAARPRDFPDWHIGYAPSATVYAELRQREKANGEKPRLLALADPTFATYESDDRKILTRNGLSPLPGSRREAAAIAKLFADGEVLAGDEPTEARLETLASKEGLKRYRYLHLATHARAHPDRPMQSTLWLADRELPNPYRELLQGRPVRLGHVTAGQIASDWRLDAALVTLSAGDFGRTEYAPGEGHLGFARALFAAGARSALVGQWPVEDEATTLLMVRFYENLLGKREGLKRPMRKAEALHEAKRWLQSLTAKQITAALPEGKQKPKERKESKPFAHPHFWSGFVLVGDPD